MTDTFEFTLNNPLTEEQWDMISDVDFDRTDRVTFYTKHGKEVEFAKVIRCKDCKNWEADEDERCMYCGEGVLPKTEACMGYGFCSMAEPKVKK